MNYRMSRVDVLVVPGEVDDDDGDGLLLSTIELRFSKMNLN